MQHPTRMKALVATADAQWQLQTDVPIPDLMDGEVLIQITAVALNPSDIKQLDNCPVEGTICGMDLAGVVVKVKRNVRKDLRIGDRVSAFVFGCNPSRCMNGAFAEYAAAKAEFCIKLPESVPPPEGASLSVGLMTCGLALRSLGLVNEAAEREPFHAPSSRTHVLVYGGSTATGTLAIQLLRYLNYIPLAVCSPRNFLLAERAGAAQCFDYKTPNIIMEVREIIGESLCYVLDCIGSPNSTTACYGVIGRDGGKYTSLAPFPDRLRMRRKNVRPEWILGYSVFGTNVNLNKEYLKEASPQDGEFAVAWTLEMESLIWQSRLQSHPIQIQPDGLRGIKRDKDLLKTGGISGKKLVYIVQDT
ncbi:GroES-like protein [Lindgomyces ingoldianus]|uniref:GroES-like protein n=1 Tax=Lindgomyces ingoldianus TaxID=673940 RepID=A0ACB6QRB4_9PLEO|nr:GroES-like protein [Lindgomyces ingoldianus]KAF2469548.1 GroES-like protein [Lindgomyces ingoldianus]